MPAVTRENFVGVFTVRDGIFMHRREEATQSEGVSFALAEVERFIGMIVSVMRVEDHPLLPKLLKGSPFEAEFSPNRTIELRRRGQTPGTGLRIAFEEGDDLIWLAQQAQAGLMAEAPGGAAGRAHAYYPVPDPPYEGRG